MLGMSASLQNSLEKEFTGENEKGRCFDISSDKNNFVSCLDEKLHTYFTVWENRYSKTTMWNEIFVFTLNC